MHIQPSVSPYRPANRHCKRCQVAWRDEEQVAPCWVCGTPTPINGTPSAYMFSNPAMAPDYVAA